MIRSAAALRNDYDGMVKLSTEKQEPIYLTRNGDGEMVFLPIELWEKRQAEPMWGIIAVPYGNRVFVKKYGWNFCQITEKRCQTSVEIEKEL